MIRQYGLWHDNADYRDHLLTAPWKLSSAGPQHADISHEMGAAYDQLDTNSCAAQAVAKIMRHAAKAQFDFSRNQIYWDARSFNHEETDDAGCGMRDAIDAVSKWGAADEVYWPFTKENLLHAPSHAARNNAARLADYAKLYARVTPSLDILTSIISGGEPFVFGMAVYESFEGSKVAKTGIMEMPTQGQRMLGRHAVTGTGFDHDVRQIKVLNSWGQDWGENGFFFMPFDYILNSSVCDDFWVIHTLGRS